jgi:DNA-binding GntR family transcriptional regulator
MRSADTSAQVQQELLSALSRGVWKPGQRLPEARVARMLNVSRTPVREAVRQLVALGVLEQDRNQAPRVRRLPVKSLADLYDLRIELEGFAAERAAVIATDEQKAELLDAAEGFGQLLHATPRSRDADAPGWFDRLHTVEQRFHSALNRASNNTWLQRMLAQMDLLSEVLAHIRRLEPPRRLRDRLRVSYLRHRRLAELIHRGRSDSARRWHARSMRDTKRRMIDLFHRVGQQPARFPRPQTPAGPRET